MEIELVGGLRRDRKIDARFERATPRIPNQVSTGRRLPDRRSFAQSKIVTVAAESRSVARHRTAPKDNIAPKKCLRGSRQVGASSSMRPLAAALTKHRPRQPPNLAIGGYKTMRMIRTIRLGLLASLAVVTV